MAVVSFLPTLVTNMQAYFDSQGVGARVEFGRRARARQDNQGTGGANRVVLSPDPNGRAGKLSGARFKATDATPLMPRPILTWERFLVVSIWAVDSSDVENELAQWSAFEALFEATVQAVLQSAHADHEWGDPGWIEESVERFYGYAADIPLTLHGPLFAPAPVVRTPTLTFTRNPSLT